MVVAPAHVGRSVVPASVGDGVSDDRSGYEADGRADERAAIVIISVAIITAAMTVIAAAMVASAPTVVTAAIMMPAIMTATVESSAGIGAVSLLQLNLDHT